MSEFIKYQGNIAGTGSVSRAGAPVPLITTDKKPGAEGAERRVEVEGCEEEERGENSARVSGSDYKPGVHTRLWVSKVYIYHTTSMHCKVQVLQFTQLYAAFPMHVMCNASTWSNASYYRPLPDCSN